MNKKVVFITGCSSGIGYLTARLFARNGWKVFAGIRDLNGEGANKLANIAKLEELDLQLVEIDVSSETSVDNALTKFKQEQFQIDVLINNAGFGYVGPVEVFSDYEVKNQYETNVYGVLRVSRHLIPLMRAQKSGTIINISSIAGLTPFPLYGLYASSKFALESLSEAMAFELNHFGIKVSLVEPGTFETNFSKNLKKSDNIEAFPEYNRLTENFASRYNKVRPRQDPEKVARQIWEIAKKPKMRYVVGLDAKVYILAKKLLPYPIWFNILRLIYKW